MSSSPSANSEKYLVTEEICHHVDDVVAVAPRLKRLLTSLLEAGQEIAMQLQQAFQLWEQTVQPAFVQLQSLAQLVHVH